jgi:hypothetical protein
VQVQAIDDIGEEATTTITVPTERVYWHRDGERGSFTFGGYVEEDNTFAIAEGIKFKVKSDKWEPVDIPDDLGSAPSETDFGRCPDNTKVWYRIVNGNHVYIAFNIIGSSVLCEIPKEICPKREVRSLCVDSSGGIVVVCVDKYGYISARDVSGEPCFVNGIDGYIDYFI